MPWSDRDIELSVISEFLGVWQRLWELAAATQRALPVDLRDAAASSPHDVGASLTRLIPVIATFHPDVIATMRRRLRGLADFIEQLPANGEGGSPRDDELRSSDELHRVVLIDEGQAVARGLELLLRYVSSEQVDVVASSADPEDTVPLVLRHQPDAVLLRLYDLDAVRALVRELHEQFDVGVVVLVEPEGLPAAWELIHLGAAAVVPSSTSAAGLLGPVLACGGGLRVVPADAATAAARLLGDRATATADLSDRDIALWRSVAAGRSDQQIAREHHVSDRTAKRHVAALLRRIGADNRVHAAALAGRHGLLD